jgi:LPPG:FO 2-phospho-L-lactate transferase
VRTDEGVLDFQEFFVKRGARDPAREIVFEGADAARPAPGVLEAIRTAQAVLLTPSNPLVSIGPILAVPGVREALRETDARIVAVSPIVGGRALKGPADRMLRDQGLDSSALSVARLYQDFLDIMVIDNADAALRPQIEALGLDVAVTDTIMASMEKKAALARIVLNAVASPKR